MKAQVDSDLLAFRCAAAAENEDAGIAQYYVDQTLEEILVGAGADSYSLFLTGKGNFRYNIYPEYKGNRIDQERPRHLPYLRDYLMSLGAIMAEGCEADDLMGAAQGTDPENSIICSLDKDMLTIPGNHFSWEISGTSKGKRWVKPAVKRHVTEFEANHWFYTQCITGDVADNVKGIQGSGKVAAARILAPCTTEKELFDATREAYDNDDEFLLNARCLYIWRKDNDDFMETFERLK